MSRADDDGADVLGCACGAQGEATRLRAELEARTRERDYRPLRAEYDALLVRVGGAEKAEADLARLRAPVVLTEEDSKLVVRIEQSHEETEAFIRRRKQFPPQCHYDRGDLLGLVRKLLGRTEDA